MTAFSSTSTVKPSGGGATASGSSTGEAASNGGCNLNGLGDLSKLGQAGKNAPRTDFAPVPHVPPIPESAIVLIVTTLVVGIIVLAFVHLYVSSVARFMLFDAVATGRQRLREGWKRWHSHGFRYFLFQLLMIVLSLTVFGVMVAARGEGLSPVKG